MQISAKIEMEQWMAAAKAVRTARPSALAARWQNTASGAVLMQQYSLDASFVKNSEVSSSGEDIPLLKSARVCWPLPALLR